MGLRGRVRDRDDVVALAALAPPPSTRWRPRPDAFGRLPEDVTPVGRQFALLAIPLALGLAATVVAAVVFGLRSWELLSLVVVAGGMFGDAVVRRILHVDDRPDLPRIAGTATTVLAGALGFGIAVAAGADVKFAATLGLGLGLGTSRFLAPPAVDEDETPPRQGRVRAWWDRTMGFDGGMR